MFLFIRWYTLFIQVVVRGPFLLFGFRPSYNTKLFNRYLLNYVRIDEINNSVTDNVNVLMSQVLRRRRSFSSATIRRAVDRKNASLGTTSSRHEPSVRSAPGRAPPSRVKNKALFGTIRRRLKSIGKQKKASGFDDDNPGTYSNITNTTLHLFFTCLLYAPAC